MISTEMIFHIGHQFSAMLPEIKTICGRPVADAISAEHCFTLDRFVDAFESMLGSISASDVVCDLDLLPADIKPMTFLQESLAAFYESYESV